MIKFSNFCHIAVKVALFVIFKANNRVSSVDINKAAEEISKLHRQDLSKIKLELLEEWLLPENFMVNDSYIGSPRRFGDDNFLPDRFSTADRENFLKYEQKRTEIS